MHHLNNQSVACANTASLSDISNPGNMTHLNDINQKKPMQNTIAQHPPQKNVELGEQLLKRQHYRAAEDHFKAALKQVPRSGQLWHILGIAQFRGGKKTEALNSFAKSEQYDRFIDQLQVAENAMDNNDQDAFIKVLEQILQHMPVHPRAAYLKASWLMQDGQIEQAASYLAPALNYAPYNEALLHLMTLIQVQLCDLEAALNTTMLLLDVAPDKYQYWMVKADIQQNMGQLQASLASYQKALDLGSPETDTRLQMAYQQQSLGNNATAIEIFKHCLKDKECVGSAFWSLSTFSQYQATETELQTMTELQWDTTLSPEQACQVSFGLARHAEKQGAYEEAFDHYENANNLKPGTRYAPQKMQDKFAAIKRTFNATFLQTNQHLPTRQQQSQQQQSTPIFITGLPRTGSTLTEQILSAHSQVEATMELKVMPAVARRAWLMSCQKTGNQEGDLSCLTAEELQGLGDYYQQLSQVYRTDAPFFIDKLPPNYQHIGLIHKILPNAIIIDTRRQPMAWGMAVYRQYFAQGHDFSYDFGQIAHAYHNYLDLMGHWNECLPGKTHLVEYEKLVADKENHIVALLAHCGLAFEASCLTPHTQNRYVKTASSDQVRKPIYQSAISSWRHYEPYLGELQNAYEHFDL